MSITAAAIWGLAEFVPDIVKWVTGDDKDEAIANKVIDVAKSITGAETPDQALSAIQSDPSMALEYKKALLADAHVKDKLELERYKEDTKRLQIVNSTMQKEGESENWWTSGWRPFIGFITGIAFLGTVIMVGIIAYQAIESNNISSINMIPSLVFNMTTLFSIPGAILGISAHHRGAEKRTKAGIIDKIKGAK